MKRGSLIFLSILCWFFLFQTARAEADEELLRALEFYYTDDYSQALPIFRKLAEQKQTADLMFWIGRSAAGIGEYDLAAEQFQKILAIHPNLHRVRMELALAYLNAYQYDAARAEFEKIRSSSPPRSVLRDIDRYLAALEKRPDKFSWSMRLSQGYQYDSNISNGPDEDEIGDIRRTALDKKKKELSASEWITTLKSGCLYDMGKAGGFFWKGGLNFYYSDNPEYSDFNYMDADISTAIYWMGKQDIIKVPVGFSHRRYGGESLSNIFYIDPGIEHFFSETFSFTISHTLSTEDYTLSEYSEAGYDNVNHTFSAGTNFYFSERRHILSMSAGLEDNNADAVAQSYMAKNISLSYVTIFPTDTEFRFFYRWNTRWYSDALEFYEHDRLDKRHTFIGVLSQNFFAHYFVSLELAYISNDSNNDLYDFGKFTGTVNVGIKF
jgi:tetratricopeptide (TPR) repeat protein